jgi:hypothetical protein
MAVGHVAGPSAVHFTCVRFLPTICLLRCPLSVLAAACVAAAALLATLAALPAVRSILLLLATKAAPAESTPAAWLPAAAGAKASATPLLPATPAYVDVCVCLGGVACVHACVHACVRSCVRGHARACMRACVSVHTRVRVCNRVRASAPVLVWRPGLAVSVPFLSP